MTQLATRIRLLVFSCGTKDSHWCSLASTGVMGAACWLYTSARLRRGVGLMTPPALSGAGPIHGVIMNHDRDDVLSEAGYLVRAAHESGWDPESPSEECREAIALPPKLAQIVKGADLQPLDLQTLLAFWGFWKCVQRFVPDGQSADLTYPQYIAWRHLSCSLVHRDLWFDHGGRWPSRPPSRSDLEGMTARFERLHVHHGAAVDAISRGEPYCRLGLLAALLFDQSGVVNARWHARAFADAINHSRLVAGDAVRSRADGGREPVKHVLGSEPELYMADLLDHLGGTGKVGYWKRGKVKVSKRRVRVGFSDRAGTSKDDKVPMARQVEVPPDSDEPSEHEEEQSQPTQEELDALRAYDSLRATYYDGLEVIKALGVDDVPHDDEAVHEEAPRVLSDLLNKPLEERAVLAARIRATWPQGGAPAPSLDSLEALFRVSKKRIRTAERRGAGGS